MADHPGSYYSPNGDREWGEEGWGEEGSHVDDSSRSWGSQRSDTGYLSSGALSDTAHYGGDRYAGRRNHVAAVAAHLMNGEARFPSATNYLSDAQRSDVATVCSGSVADEVESVLSQEDQVNNPIHSPSERQLLAPGTNLLLSIGGTSGAEFADAQLPPPETEPGATVVPGKDPLLLQSLQTQTTSAIESPLAAPSELTVAYLREDEAMPMHSMGPPLNRALLLQRTGGSSPQAGGSAMSFSSEGMALTHSDDGQGSIDMEPHWNQEDTRRMENAESARKSAIDSAKSPHSKDAMSQAGSVKSYGSNCGSDCAALVDTDDCGGSLDVETHSIETRSIHSQDDAPNVEMTEASKPETPEELQTNPLLTTELPDSNGRRSPGGTIYKGRGVRRYQGRYMHLPLKRFHQNGVHLDAVDEGSSFQVPVVNVEQVNGFTGNQWEDPRRRTPIPMNGGFQREGSRSPSPSRFRNRSRSRSRSRSPPTMDSNGNRFSERDGDRKPRSRPRNDRPNDYRDDRSPERDWSRR